MSTSDKEDLDDLIDKRQTVGGFLGHIYFAYFFTAFWLIVLYMAAFNETVIVSRIPNVPPWLIIGGAVLLLVKNIWKIISHHKKANR